MARHEDGSTNILKSDFEQVCQPVAPQVTQLWYKKLDNKGYVVTWSRAYYGFSIVSSSFDLEKGMVHASGFLLWWHMSLMIELIFDLSMWASILVYISLKSLWRIWWWCCIHLCYDMIHFMMIMHVIKMYTLWCWCTPIQYDVHAYHSVMMISYALWCIIDDYDA